MGGRGRRPLRSSKIEKCPVEAFYSTSAVRTYGYEVIHSEELSAENAMCSVRSGGREAALAHAHEKVCEADSDEVLGYGDEDILHMESLDQAGANLISAEGADHATDSTQRRTD